LARASWLARVLLEGGTPLEEMAAIEARQEEFAVRRT
jgi:hypothetical protein